MKGAGLDSFPGWAWPTLITVLTLSEGTVGKFGRMANVGLRYPDCCGEQVGVDICGGVVGQRTDRLSQGWGGS